MTDTTESPASNTHKNGTDHSAPPESVSLMESFLYWLKLGFLSFGGPAGQISMMHQELVENRRWISNQRFLHALNYTMVLPGPEAQVLNNEFKSQFTKHTFVVSNNSNRMGYRLTGKWTSSDLDLGTIISSGNVRGVVQLTPSLEPIILLNDAGTTGGYPRIGICEDPDLIAQIKPNEKIRFEWISY